MLEGGSCTSHQISLTRASVVKTGSANGVLSIPFVTSDRFPVVASASRAAEDRSRATSSASSSTGDGGRGGYSMLATPGGSLPPAFCVACARTLCQPSYRDTSACRSLWYSCRQKQSRCNVIFDLLLPVPFERLHTLVKQIRIDLHKQLQGVIHHPVNRPEIILSAFLEHLPSKISHRFQCDFEFW